MAFSIDGNRLRAITRSGAIMLRSCTSAAVTARLIRSPSVSTTVWRFFPLIFLPASYPTESTFGPLFLRFSRSGCRRCRASVRRTCLHVTCHQYAGVYSRWGLQGDRKGQRPSKGRRDIRDPSRQVSHRALQAMAEAVGFGDPVTGADANDILKAVPNADP